MNKFWGLRFKTQGHNSHFKNNHKSHGCSTYNWIYTYNISISNLPLILRLEQDKYPKQVGIEPGA